MTTLGRVTRRALLLGGGVAVGWLLSAGLHAPAAAATTLVPGVTGVVAPLSQYVPALDQAATVTSPILGPAESRLIGTPTGGPPWPPLAPIQGPPTGANPPGVLLIAPAVRRLAEPVDALLASASRAAARAMMATLPGSVPLGSAAAAAPAALSPDAMTTPPVPGPVDPRRAPPPGPDRILLVLPPVPGIPIGPTEPLTDLPGSPDGGTGSGSGPPHGDTDREVPVPGATESRLGTRSPPHDVTGALHNRADDPSFSPD